MWSKDRGKKSTASKRKTVNHRQDPFQGISVGIQESCIDSIPQIQHILDYNTSNVRLQSRILFVFHITYLKFGMIFQTT